ncbi:MAG TPA: hypothetical protein VIG44_07745 [Thermomicrobiales bacterium]
MGILPRRGGELIGQPETAGVTSTTYEAAAGDAFEEGTDITEMTYACWDMPIMIERAREG